MSNSLVDVKKRLSSTKSTAQITKAMYMVSSSKIKRAEKTHKGYKDFVEKIKNVISNVLATADEDFEHPLFTPREVKKTAYLIITSDRGLAGTYNSSIFKELDSRIKNHNGDYICAVIGKKGFSFLQRRGYHTLGDSHIAVRDDVMFMDMNDLVQNIINIYVSGEIDQLIVIYNHFVNNLVQEVRSEVLLPITPIEATSSNDEYVYEGGVETTLDLVLPMYVKDLIYGIILDAKCAEHSARMNAMKSATDNANEVIEKLQLLYNRARQNVITNELIDIIGGANAIGGDN
jgi:F-type H+-transporting ATPase subunit gamma